jgi:hypothetical protein
MDWWLVVLIVGIALVSRPIEARLWRAGRLSDRKLTLLLIGRFPVIVGLFAALAGASLPMIVFLVAISLLPGLFLYRFALGVVQENSTADRT